MLAAAAAVGAGECAISLKRHLYELLTPVNNSHQPHHCCSAAVGAEELEKRLHVMQKEQKLIQAEAQAAVLEAAASAPATMAGAHAGTAAAATNKDRVLEVGQLIVDTD